MNHRPLLIFYLLLIYIFLQLAWWAWLLYDLNAEYFSLKTEIYGPADPDSGLSFSDKLRKRQWMILGEGAVFLFFLILGLRTVHRNFTREIASARRQKNFLLAIAHELKSPLASIKLNLQTLLRPNLDVSKADVLKANALADSERMEMLTENILLAYKLEDTGYPLHRQPLAVKDELEKIIRQLPVNDTQRQRIILDLPESQNLHADMLGFSSIVRNLVENALKYAPAGPVIIRVSASPKSVRLSISDEGPGIPAAEKEKVFDRFYRGGNENTRTAKGTGLGLYIARKLAEAHGGTLSLRDNLPKGTVFEVTFPTPTAL